MPQEQTVTTTTGTPAPVENQSNASGSPAGVEAQSSSQEGTTQTKTEALNNQPTTDVAVVKAVPKETPKDKPKIDLNDLLEKQMDGTITPEELKSIEDSGYPKEHFLLAAEAQRQIQLKNNAQLYDLVGGEQSYEELKSFAAENLSEDEINGYNAALRSGNMKLAEMAVLGLQAMHHRLNGKHPQQVISGEGNVMNSIEAYSNQQELIKDLNSRKYKTDPEFKALVDKRRNKSGF